MCVGLFTLDHPDFALILCTNRDEFLSRPTIAAQFHDFGQEPTTPSQQGSILSGLDAKGGGTWLGINRSGRTALLFTKRTNITEPPPTEMASSRGRLVSSFLLSDSSHPLEDQIGKMIPRDAKYAGFNLLLLVPKVSTSITKEGNTLDVLSFDGSIATNGGANGTITSRTLTPEERHCGGISNGVEGQCDWPKVTHGVQLLSALLKSITSDVPEADIVDHLLELLTWRSAEPPRERKDLRNTIFVDPFPLNLAEESDHCHPEFYGTRLSTVILIRRDGQVVFVERNVCTTEEGEVTKAHVDALSDRVFRFKL